MDNNFIRKPKRLKPLENKVTLNLNHDIFPKSQFYRVNAKPTY